MNRSTLIQTTISHWRFGFGTVLGSLLVLLLAVPALAHHPLGGSLPSTPLEGLMSGLAHPVIGVDHFAFLIAAGLVGILIENGFVIPIVFVLAALGGTGLHLAAFDLPAIELMIAVSVGLFGLLIGWGKPLNLILLGGLGAIAGIFHGYAYGEAIVGAEMTPLFAYLIGFSSIQLAICLGIWKLGKSQIERNRTQALINLRFIGFTLCGAGVAFLNAVMVG
ncbi:HupE/UreJ family protein [filamentous cyanobacterium LEGE 11480]|uniref:HupE/UreJ family protein n=1 Tax=Romeriopsis navalis LEGE 11480 TaxID=2777977 RepID=A0A928VIG1_9CYAN|nr:HupE/UreJ family protein [Romeriopsis navalis]MBE9028358.1 HupE/UreJ family protein [Romeriopsis navalis LEGE 11480]